MNSNQRLQKVFYLPLEYQIFLQSPLNLSTAVFPYSFQYCNRIKRPNFVQPQFSSLPIDYTPHYQNSPVIRQVFTPQDINSWNHRNIKYSTDLNQNSLLSNHYVFTNRSNTVKKMSNDDIILVGSIKPTGHVRPRRYTNPSNVHNSEVTITKFVTTNRNKSCLGDVIVLHSTYDSNPRQVRPNNPRQVRPNVSNDVIFVESVHRNPVLSKRKSDPEVVLDDSPKVPRGLNPSATSKSSQNNTEISTCESIGTSELVRNDTESSICESMDTTPSSQIETVSSICEENASTSSSNMIDKGKAQIDEGKAQIDEGKAQIDEGKVQIDEGKAQILPSSSKSNAPTSSSSMIDKNKAQMLPNSSKSPEKTVKIQNQHPEPSCSLSMNLSMNISNNLQFSNFMSNNSIHDTSNDDTSACMINTDTRKITQESGPDEVKIMSYNILAQTLLVRHVDLYRHCHGNMQYLQADYRFRNIVNEIIHYNCDIVCLQEVEEEDLNYLGTKLAPFGYKHVYKKRTGGNVDGCAVLYKYKKYAVSKCKFVEYFKSDNHHLFNRHNVGVIVNLRSQRQSIIVANTHLLYNPSRSDIRLAQCKQLLSQIKFMYDTSGSRNTSVVITGDMNSTPNSALVKFILNNKDFKFKSAYDLNSHLASTYHDEWTLVDFIFYTSDKLNLSNLKSLPQYNREAIARVPNKFEGSDHLSLVAMFKTQ